MSDSSKIFEPSSQLAYWSSLDPDLRVFLDDFEMKESWTYDYSELPGLFKELGEALPKIASINNMNKFKPIVDDLMHILSSMSFRLCITAISWLDRNVESQESHGWGVAVFLEASEMAKQDDDSRLTLSAKMVYERIRIILMTRIAVKVFTNIPKR